MSLRILPSLLLTGLLLGCAADAATTGDESQLVASAPSGTRVRASHALEADALRRLHHYSSVTGDGGMTVRVFYNTSDEAKPRIDVVIDQDGARNAYAIPVVADSMVRRVFVEHGQARIWFWTEGRSGHYFRLTPGRDGLRIEEAITDSDDSEYADLATVKPLDDSIATRVDDWSETGEEEWTGHWNAAVLLRTGDASKLALKVDDTVFLTDIALKDVLWDPWEEDGIIYVAATDLDGTEIELLVHLDETLEEVTIEKRPLAP